MPSPAPPDADADAAIEAAISALHAAGRLTRQRVAGIDLDAGSFWLLRVLATEGPHRITALATAAGLDPSTVSRQISQLERSGLVDRTPDPDDRRAQLVGVSDAGKDRLHAAMAKRRALLSESFRAWPTQDVADFARLLERFTTDLESRPSGKAASAYHG